MWRFEFLEGSPPDATGPESGAAWTGMSPRGCAACASAWPQRGDGFRPRPFSSPRRQSPLNRAPLRNLHLVHEVECDAEVASRSQFEGARPAVPGAHPSLTTPHGLYTLSTPMDERDLDGTGQAFAESLEELRPPCGNEAVPPSGSPVAEPAGTGKTAAGWGATCYVQFPAGRGARRLICPMRPPGRDTPVSAGGNAARPSEAWRLRGTGKPRGQWPCGPAGDGTSCATVASSSAGAVRALAMSR